jgi:hypothetical protein
MRDPKKNNAEKPDDEGFEEVTEDHNWVPNDPFGQDTEPVQEEQEGDEDGG